MCDVLACWCAFREVGWALGIESLPVWLHVHADKVQHFSQFQSSIAFPDRPHFGNGGLVWVAHFLEPVSGFGVGRDDLIHMDFFDEDGFIADDDILNDVTILLHKLWQVIKLVLKHRWVAFLHPEAHQHRHVVCFGAFHDLNGIIVAHGNVVDTYAVGELSNFLHIFLDLQGRAYVRLDGVNDGTDLLDGEADVGRIQR